MKNTIFFLLFQIVVLVSTQVIAQTDSIDGKYFLDTKNSDIVKRTLVLNTDGTFEFYAYEKHEAGIPPEKNFYAKGLWSSNKNLVSFSAENGDFDEKFTLNFNNTKARFHTKSPRDKSIREIKTTLRFYESKIFWIKGMTLVKVSG